MKRSEILVTATPWDFSRPMNWLMKLFSSGQTTAGSGTIKWHIMFIKETRDHQTIQRSQFFQQGSYYLSTMARLMWWEETKPFRRDVSSHFESCSPSYSHFFLQHWMTNAYNTIKSKSLSQLALPGSHDAGMYLGGTATLGKNTRLNDLGSTQCWCALLRSPSRLGSYRMIEDFGFFLYHRPIRGQPEAESESLGLDES